MDIKQMLPMLLKGKLGEREQALLKLTENPNPDMIGTLITQMYAKKPQVDLFSTFKKIIPAQTLGQIIKYYDSGQNNY